MRLLVYSPEIEAEMLLDDVIDPRANPEPTGLATIRSNDSIKLRVSWLNPHYVRSMVRKAEGHLPEDGPATMTYDDGQIKVTVERDHSGRKWWITSVLDRTPIPTARRQGPAPSKFILTGPNAGQTVIQ